MARASKPASLVLVSLLMVFGSGVALAGSQDLAVVALHEKVHSLKSTVICPGLAGSVDPNTAGISCADYSVDNAPLLSGRDVYLVVARGNAAAGIAGLSCGITYTANVAMYGFQLCSDLQFPNGGWPADGGGNRITWAASSNCQETTIGAEGVHAIAGSFYVYAYGDGSIEVTPNNNLVIPEFRVADCSAAESSVSIGGGRVGFGGVTGFNPCQLPPVPVEQTSWGRIKGRTL